MTDPLAPNPIQTVAILTLGCKLNQAESESMARELVAAGCRVVDRPAAADAFIINTCSVTHVADRKSRHLVRLARRLSPGAAVVLTGCYAETAGQSLRELTGADLVVDNRDKTEVVRRLLALRPPVCHDGAAFRPPAEAGRLRTRAFVKAQEGCNDVCAFCIVPFTRGRERSVPVAEVVAAVRAREAEGVQEVVITGTQLGAYGRDLGSGQGPYALIRALLAETAVPRIRFSSLQPQDINERLLALWEDPRLCRHFHLALQSGSDTTLRRMRRRYTLDRYRQALALIRSHVPEAAVTTDVMVGFPGETEGEFQETEAFCREAGFAGMHVFPYSRRPHTTANLLREHVPEPVKKERLARLLAVARESARAFRSRLVGRTASVLWEEAQPAPAGGLPVWEGLTDTYVRVFLPSGQGLRNRLTAVRVLGLTDEGVLAEPLP
ncbi:MAG TPA: tRNA (N(6)-L-threonylcarbamoyladenosine(37)-C(2))-methylthiotransferase MtaB [Dehalococcoidia bacterium]